MIMWSKGTLGTGLSAGATATQLKTRQNWQQQQKKSSEAAAACIFFFFYSHSPQTDRLKAVFWWPFAKAQPSQSMLSFIFT